MSQTRRNNCKIFYQIESIPEMGKCTDLAIHIHGPQELWRIIVIASAPYRPIGRERFFPTFLQLLPMTWNK